MHNKLKPKTYLEIGCRTGKSLALSNCLSIAVDPDFRILEEIKAPSRIFKKTSDQFFETIDVIKLLGRKIDFAFIDGMHKSEYALRDFINIERLCKHSSVIVIDDILPKKMIQAERERQSDIWMGDIYIVLKILKEYRPDLNITIIETKIKGLGIIRNLNPSSTKLQTEYNTIEEKILTGKYNAKTIAEIRNQYQFVNVEELIEEIRQL